MNALGMNSLSAHSVLPMCGSDPAIAPPVSPEPAALASRREPLTRRGAGAAPSFIPDPRHKNKQPWGMSRILIRLRLAAGGVVSVQDLEAALSGNREDGGAYFATNNVAVF